MVMAQSLFIALKNTQPDCQIDVLAPAWTLSLLERMPEVNKAIAMPLPRGQFGLMERIRLGLSLRSESYDQAILLPNSWKSAIRLVLCQYSRAYRLHRRMPLGLAERCQKAG